MRIMCEFTRRSGLDVSYVSRCPTRCCLSALTRMNGAGALDCARAENEIKQAMGKVLRLSVQPRQLQVVEGVKSHELARSRTVGEFDNHTDQQEFPHRHLTAR